MQMFFNPFAKSLEIRFVFLLSKDIALQFFITLLSMSFSSMSIITAYFWGIFNSPDKKNYTIITMPPIYLHIIETDIR